MQRLGDQVVLSATDLANFLSCRHRTALDRAATFGERAWPPRFEDPLLDILIARGKAHEAAYVASLQSKGQRVVDLNHIQFHDRDARLAQTTAAMQAGADVIVQAGLGNDRWYGMADVLQRVERPSRLGGWSYEIADTKLARETKAGTILQLGLYSELLADAQGLQPEHFRVVTPDPLHPVETYRVNDYAAYFRAVRIRAEEAVARSADLGATRGLGERAKSASRAAPFATYPEPVEHCFVCPWQQTCREQWRVDDHLTLVAGISRNQRRELEARQVTTLTALAALPTPIPFRPSRGSRAAYERVRDQALVQLQSRGRSTPLHTLRPLEDGMGLHRLPEPCEGDVFLDLEGDPYAVEKGREYLFGFVTVDGGAPTYHAAWGMNDAAERAAFEQVLDVIMERRQRWPAMHVYHYAPYEPAAFKKLAGRYATRESALDALLRGECFVDLYAIVRQAMLVGVDRYSIKSLEPVYGFTRDVDLARANRALHTVEACLERGCVDVLPVETLDAVRRYNRDDCLSTLRLRDWLEGVSASAIADGLPIVRPQPASPEPPPAVDERAMRVEALRARLLDGLPAEGRNDAQQARWLLAYLLDWHRREDKATWWEYFRLRSLPDEDLLEERQALSGLRFAADLGAATGKSGKPTKSVIHRYEYPPQDSEVDPGDELHSRESAWGEVIAVDRDAGTIDVKKGPQRAGHHATAAFAHSHVKQTTMEDALFTIGEAMATTGVLPAAGRHAAAHRLLARQTRSALPEGGAPCGPASRRAGASGAPAAPNVDPVEDAVATAVSLHDEVFAIQGPPGAGKTFTAARMIVALVRAGKRVGVTANSHQVIRKVLEDVHKAPGGEQIRMGHKDRTDAAPPPAWLDVTDDYAEARDWLETGSVRVLGGTSFLWAREEFEGAVDVLFIDEAGQLSLANAVAVSRGARAVVLLGDPQQLRQPTQGSHPDGVGVSALEHLLGGEAVMPANRGMFLPETHRLHPELCAFTSEVFYESALRSRPGLDGQHLNGTRGLDGSGLVVVPVRHSGNRNAADEEVDVVADLVARLTREGATWTDGTGAVHPLTTAGVLVVSPYNAQVTRLQQRLDPLGVHVGTVDKFQGQERPVVIYSMATSIPEDAPRGMEFLYSPNRLNVATSRARCLAILVASPALFEPECTSPRQMKLANALCRFLELALLDRDNGGPRDRSG
ncbi:MAG: TM0106 family RecB-like putative nuclease [Gemmatimonadaceae bacterium]|nr:TM0106 family RecB-like putative nuclease [Gemmatimonadaceae bacterium]